MARKVGVERRPQVPQERTGTWVCTIEGCRTAGEPQEALDQTPQQAFDKHYRTSGDPDHHRAREAAYRAARKAS